MHIGIDARLIEETGVGRYIRNLIKHLVLIDKKNTYTIFLRKKNFDSFAIPNSRWKKVMADVPWHSISEQVLMPFILYKEHLDLVHVPYHNPPIFYPGNIVVTIHDLIILHFDTGKASTLPIALYKLKRLGYWAELFVSLKRAKKIIAVSENTKQEIVSHFRIHPEKIVVTYEGVDNNFRIQNSKLKKDPYFLYVGNAYPHKNLEILLEVWKNIKEKLILVGREDYFYKKINQHNNNQNIIFFGHANDTQLSDLYTNAKALIFPSLMEGFGLPGLESLSLGCPVICSDIPVFHEIFGDNVTYFDPKNIDDIAKKLNEKIKKPTLPKQFFEKFDWKKLAHETKNIYENSIRV